MANRSMGGCGAHEVIIESPEHERFLGHQPVEHIEIVLRTLQLRFNDLLRDSLQSSFGQVEAARLRPLAEILKVLLSKLYTGLDNPAFNHGDKQNRPRVVLGAGYLGLMKP